MPDVVDLAARAERAERRLAELQVVLRETDRERMHERVLRAERSINESRQGAQKAWNAYRTYRAMNRRTIPWAFAAGLANGAWIGMWLKAWIG